MYLFISFVCIEENNSLPLEMAMIYILQKLHE